ncbi:hypothetical protein KFU94_65690 [Chloroflexi bacterium TSY]|nr:hypothetical protein [Chloroflexi bacterium TSY]
MSRQRVGLFQMLDFASSCENGWLSGNPLQVEVPGLITGLEGVGYPLLSLDERQLSC